MAGRARLRSKSAEAGGCHEQHRVHPPESRAARPGDSGTALEVVECAVLRIGWDGDRSRFATHHADAGGVLDVNCKMAENLSGTGILPVLCHPVGRSGYAPCQHRGLMNERRHEIRRFTKVRPYAEWPVITLTGGVTQLASISTGDTPVPPNSGPFDSATPPLHLNHREGNRSAQFFFGHGEDALD